MGREPRTSTRARGSGDGPLMRVLAGLACVAAIVAIVVRAEVGSRFLEGDSSLLRGLAVAGLVSALVIALMFWRIHGRYASLRRHSERRGAEMSAVMATSHEWLWEATPDLVFVSCSASTSTMLGYAPEEMVGRSAFDLVDPAFVPVMRTRLTVALRERTGWRDLYARWQHRDGHFVDTVGNAEPILGPDGSVAGFRGARQWVPDAVEGARLAEIRTRVQGHLDRETVTIALQPVVNLLEGCWHNVEALARFADGRPPETWFAEARAVGLGADLELLALRRALDHMVVLPPHVHLSANVSAELVFDPRLESELTRTDLDPSRLVLEITEHTVIDDYEALRGRLDPLRRRGIRVAVDDTGAGYASFRHVLRLRPDVVKLDRSLLQDLHDNAAARALINAVVMLALELGATVTAEGVEDYATLDAVAALGVDDAQGFFLARPSCDPADWATWLRRDWAEAVGRRVPAV